MENQSIYIPAPGAITAEVLQVVSFTETNQVYRLRLNGQVFDVGMLQGKIEHVEFASDDMTLPDYTLTASAN